MKDYLGSSASDPLLVDDGEIVVDEYNGHEAAMFSDIAGRVYGGFWPGRVPGSEKIREVHIEKLDVDTRVLFADHVEVIFVARELEAQGLYAVGHYRDARVYRHLQVPPDEDFEYNITARTNNCVPIPVDQRRVFEGIDWRQGAYRFYDDNSTRSFNAILKHLGIKA